MENDWTKWLHERAYALWEDDNRPDGRHDEHWRRAEQDLRREEAREGTPDREQTTVSSPSAKD